MDSCPCESNKPYAECCEPHHRGASWPTTAVALMRARYCAYVKQEFEFLQESLHPRARSGHDPDSAREWATNSEWLGLDIRSQEAGGENDEEGKVEFVARYRTPEGNDVDHHERATFERSNGRWAFLKGASGVEPIVRSESKVNRNDPCTCGSGKKFKKCCMTS